MSDMRDDMIRTLDRIVEDTFTPKVREAADEFSTELRRPAGEGGDPTQPLWSTLEEAGITTLGNSADDGDITFADSMALVRQAAFHALPVPLGDAIVARRVRAAHALG